MNFKKCTFPISIVLALLAQFSISAQIRLMSYNILNFPTGNLAGRVDTLRNIVDYSRPHLLMIQELKNEEGLADITSMMNELDYGTFAHSTFVSQQSNPGATNLLQHAIVFDQNILKLKSENFVLTEYRDVNEFELYLNDPQLINGADTVFINVYVTHLKSAEGDENEQLRLGMVESWKSYLELNIPEDRNVIFAGDFNLYSTDEPAYQSLIDENNFIVMKDVFADYGDWSGTDFEYKEIHTQSTRASTIFNDGAGGGVDDRFDFILFSESLLDSDGEVYYAPESFISLGNTGNCYNMSITDCADSNPIPEDVIQSIYYMSDHIPQTCELITNVPLGASEHTATDELNILFSAGNIFSNYIKMELVNQTGMPVSLLVADELGKTVFHNYINALSTNYSFQLPAEQFSTGTYVIRLSNEAGQFCVKRFVVAAN